MSVHVKNGVVSNVDDAGPATIGAATTWNSIVVLQSLNSPNALLACTRNEYRPIGRSFGTVKFNAFNPVAEYARTFFDKLRISS